MSALGIVLIVLAALVLALFGLGLVAAVRARGAGADRFQAAIQEANRALADARAADVGWDMPALESVARETIARNHPNANVRALRLVQCIDRPGTDEDRAVFRVDVARGRDFDVILGRRDGLWVELETR